jgi:hypothetical protein
VRFTLAWYYSYAFRKPRHNMAAINDTIDRWRAPPGKIIRLLELILSTPPRPAPYP